MSHKDSAVPTPLVTAHTSPLAPSKSDRSPGSTMGGKYTDYTVGRIYASNAPKILLETITARTASIVISLTYAFFVFGFLLDFYTTYRSFHSSNYVLTAMPCDTVDQTTSAQQTSWSCGSSSFWNGTLSDLRNVISVQLDVSQRNVSGLLSNATSQFPLSVHIEVWACYNQYGCGTHFSSNDHYTSDPGVWQHMYTESKQLLVDQELDETGTGTDEQLSIQLVPSTFQNQESIPTNGLVRSYHFSVEYLQNEYGLFGQGDANPTSYTVDVVERPRQIAVNVMCLILLCITLVVGSSYVMMLRQQKAILSEQKWVVAYFALLVLFQNPLYCAIVFYKDPPSIGISYASYIIGYLAQSGLFILWLLFADSVLRKMSSVWRFYLPKTLIGVTIFTCGVLILTFQFPGLSAGSHSDKRSAVRAVANWSPSEKKYFISFTFTYLILIWGWTVWWFFRLYRTGSTLKKLPYMSTRYIQLSYRYFSLQATLVTLYYVFQYVVVIIFISQGVNSSMDNTTLTDNINILFRQQTQLFGKTLFLSVYAFILAFLFLPASLMENPSGLMASLSATYVISQQEHAALVRSRRATIRSMRRNLSYQLTLMNQLVSARADVFCVDEALSLRNVAFQAYYDPPGLESLSGYEGGMRLDKVGFELVDLTYNRDHEVFCFVAREISTGRLVVGFRGTASKRQMEDNLRYTQRAVVFSALTTATLDGLDGLSIKGTDAAEDDLDLPSVSDDEEDDKDIDLGSEHGRSLDRDAPTLRATIAEGAGAVGGGLRAVLSGATGVAQAVVGAAGAVTGAAVDATAGLAASAASRTPVLKNIVKIYVHSGFWEAYEHVRDFIHAILRRELAKHPTSVSFTGHSLGGALATFAALDVSLHTVPRVNAYLKHMERKKIRAGEDPEDGKSLFRKFSQTLFTRSNSTGTGGSRSSMSPSEAPTHSTHKFVNKIKITMYNFGSPRVGNSPFANFYDRIVPNSYRVVVDGDIVPALPPPSKYTHVGTEILIDSVGAGSIIIDPSFVERWLRTHMKSSVAVHSLLVYRKGLLGIKLAAEFMRDHAKELTGRDSIDPLKLALKVRVHSQVDSILDENAGIFVDLVGVEAQKEEGQRDARKIGQGQGQGQVLGIDEGAESPASDLELMSDSDPGLSPDNSLSMVGSQNPLLAGAIQDAVNSPPGRGSRGGVYEVSAGPDDLDFSMQNRAALAAAHYAHDVEHMDALISQISSSKGPGPVQWMKRAASQTLRAASPMQMRGQSKSERKEKEERSAEERSPTRPFMKQNSGVSQSVEIVDASELV